MQYDPTTQTATMLLQGNTVFAADTDISAVYLRDDGWLVLSVSDSADLGGITFSREDLVEYDPVNNYANLILDGNLYFATGASINAIHINPVDWDGDGVADIDDAFPDDASETIDTDDDGIGDNADFDPGDATVGAAVTWNLDVPMNGQYDVYVRWTASGNRTSEASYVVGHGADPATTQTTVVTDQLNTGGDWVSIGTYDFEEGTSPDVSLLDSGDGFVIADALQLRWSGTNPPLQTGMQVFHVHNDHLGTPQIITAADQQVVWAAEYIPYGEVSITTELIENPMRFPGQYFDQETGLHYNYFRDYDSSVGRYIQSDPIGLQGGLNTYGYVSNSPLRWMDPFGLEEGSPANLAKRKLIDELARSYNGSKAWCFACKKGNFAKNTNKCNKFVYDVANEAGAEPVAKGRQPLASEWAAPYEDIPDWRSLEPGETRQPGDVAAYRLTGGGTSYSGHTGIITSDGNGGTTNTSAHGDSVSPYPNQFSGNPNTNYRRYTGE